MVQETTAPHRPSIWPFESTALEELCKADGLVCQALTGGSAHHSGSMASMQKWCDQPHWCDVSGSVHPLLQTQRHFSKASEDLRKAVESDHHCGELCTQYWRGVLRTSAQKMARLTCGPNATIKNSRRWQTMPPLPGSTITYPRCQTLCSGRPCGRLHKAVSGPCQGYREFLQDDFPPRHGETSELWKPSKHLPAVTAAQQLSCSQPRHLSTDVCRAFSFSPSLQAKLPPVSCASQNDLPHDILLCVSASLWVAAPPLPGSIVFLSWLEWVLYSSCWGCLTEFCNLFLQAIVFLYSEKRVITWKGVPI